MTEQEIDSFIREKCGEANLSLVRCPLCPEGCEVHDKSLHIYRPIQLADILMAMKGRRRFLLDGNKFIFTSYDIIVDYFYWNLSLPYEQQDIEVKRFIYEILK